MGNKSKVGAKKSSMPVGILSTPAWLAVKFYKVAISPVVHLTGARCRFYPTCSEYAMAAIEKHGAVKGIILSVCRLLRCQPLCKGGLDFVPEKFEWKKLFSQNKVDESGSLDN